MSDEFVRVKAIVIRARELSGDARAAYLSEACGQEPGLRAEVEALLDHADDTPSILATGGVGAADPGGAAAGTGDGDGRRPRRHRTVHTPGGARRRWHGDGVSRRAGHTHSTSGCAEARQTRARYRSDRGALRGGTAGTGADGSSAHRASDRRRRQPRRPPVLRDGAGRWCACHHLLRAAADPARRALDAVSRNLPGRAARAPARDHPPRSEAVEHPRARAGRRPVPQDHRLRDRQGDRRFAHGHDAHDAGRAVRRDAGVHESRAGWRARRRRGHPQRRLLARRAPLRAPDRMPAVRVHDAIRRPRSSGCLDSRNRPSRAFAPGDGAGSSPAISTTSSSRRSRRRPPSATARWSNSRTTSGGTWTVCRCAPARPHGPIVR